MLRYWESEFPSLHPKKRISGQRLFTRKDIESALKIKELLYKENFTINGARKKLQEHQLSNKKKPVVTIEDVKNRLLKILEMLES